MEPAVTMPASPAPAPGRESAELRARRLAAARRRATALLAAATIVFVAVTVAGGRGAVPGYLPGGGQGGLGVGGAPRAGAWLRGGRCRAGHGRRCGGLVRGDGLVPPAPGPADTAHRV